MSAHILLNLLNEFRKDLKCEAMPGILSFVKCVRDSFTRDL